MEKFYPEALQGQSAKTIERITNGLKRKDLTLTSLIQVADAMVMKSGVQVAAAVEPDQEQRGENGCLMYNGEECNGERAGTCKERTCHCVGQWTGLRCQSGPSPCSLYCLFGCVMSGCGYCLLSLLSIACFISPFVTFPPSLLVLLCRVEHQALQPLHWSLRGQRRVRRRGGRLHEGMLNNKLPNDLTSTCTN